MTVLRELAERSGPKIVCCVCGEPCSVYSPICAKCAEDIAEAIEPTSHDYPAKAPLIR